VVPGPQCFHRRSMASGTEWSIRPYPLCTHWLGRTLLKWRSSPFGDLFVCAKDLFVEAMVTIAPCQNEPSRQFK
jgi:hypothetical protein